jgi:hypothetical protein
MIIDKHFCVRQVAGLVGKPGRSFTRVTAAFCRNELFCSNVLASAVLGEPKPREGWSFENRGRNRDVTTTWKLFQSIVSVKATGVRVGDKPKPQKTSNAQLR